MSKSEFLKNYTGIYDAEKAYQFYSEKKENKESFSNATYSENENRSLERMANEESFNRNIRKKNRNK